MVAKRASAVSERRVAFEIRVARTTSNGAETLSFCHPYNEEKSANDLLSSKPLAISDRPHLEYDMINQGPDTLHVGLQLYGAYQLRRRRILRIPLETRPNHKKGYARTAMFSTRPAHYRTNCLTNYHTSIMQKPPKKPVLKDLFSASKKLSCHQ